LIERSGRGKLIAGNKRAFYFSYQHLMNTRRPLAMLLCLCTFGLCGLSVQVCAQTNNVTVSGLTYVFSNGGVNPTLTLYRGVTYIFSLSTIGHPFYIKTNFSDGTANAYSDGVVNNGTTSGLLAFSVPAAAPNQLFYNCAVHSSFGMRGTFNILNPPAPPTGEIVLISISPGGVTLKSIGATNWSAIPEYSSNLLSSAWATVPNYTNSLANNTNTTTFGRLDAICGPEVFLRVRNRFP
jgi:hypothetical protein